ncbi:EAL domain-containing protein (plasmid) [Phyllobacterium sp. 628]|uniref:EAL domain-containing protein n=1 Tax=Phyllobacterium sp. 628 TaxID=2718938 RepID=UPI00166268D6|nr:EAL domain-containing protein [Phyllobacterium sp. 628]QND54932.1 EAL domain-containing protein [Phyllobacterium sp. 628]
MRAVDGEIEIEAVKPSRIGYDIPVVVLVGVPLVTLMLLAFLSLGLILQHERNALSAESSERVADLLSRDMQERIDGRFAPVASFVDTLVAKADQSGCHSTSCMFTLIDEMRASPTDVPEEVGLIGFGDNQGQFKAAFRTKASGLSFAGNIQSMPDDPHKRETTVPGMPDAFETYDIRDRQWYQRGILSNAPVWTAPFKSIWDGSKKIGGDRPWNVTRVTRISDADGKPLGVIAVDVDMGEIASLIGKMAGNTLKSVSFISDMGNEISVVDNQLVVTSESAKANHQFSHIRKEVPLGVEGLDGWRLVVTLGAELSRPLALQPMTWILFLGGLLASLYAAAVTASLVVTPVKRLSGAAVNVSNLDFDAPVDANTHVKEIALLARLIDKMRAALHVNQERLEFLAYHDPVTGFLNYAGLSNAYNSMKVSEERIDLVLIKIANHNHISSVLGENALARIVARNIALIKSEIAGSTVGCTNESQIVCLVESEKGVDEQKINELLARLRKPHEEENLRCSTDILASVSSRLSESDNFDILLQRANGALYHAEEMQSETAVWYNPLLFHDLREALEFSGNVVQVIADGEFLVEFQPIIDLKSGHISGAQAKIFWRHAQLGLIEQSKFVPIFEKNGSIRHVGLYAISQTFEFLNHFKARYRDKELVVSVSLSLVQLLDPLFIERVAELQTEWQIRSREIKFVITQNASALEDPQILHSLRQLHRLGFQLAVDRFGMDNASLNGLVAVQYSSILICPSLQHNIEVIGPERTILESICGLANKLNMDSVAVGIENNAIIEPLIECGCTHGVGPWFGLPMAKQGFLDSYARNATILSVTANAVPRKRSRIRV